MRARHGGGAKVRVCRPYKANYFTFYLMHLHLNDYVRGLDNVYISGLIYT